MRFNVIFSTQALEEIDEIYCWLVEQTPLNAPKWHDGLLEAVTTLEDNPRRCPLAPENERASEETRQFLYGKRQHKYRILFTIRDDVVWILHVRNGARQTFE